MTNSKKVNHMIEETLEQSSKIIADLHDLSLIHTDAADE